MDPMNYMRNICIGSHRQNKHYHYFNCLFNIWIVQKKRKRRRKILFTHGPSKTVIHNQPKLPIYCLFISINRTASGTIGSTFGSTIISKWLRHQRPTTDRIVWYPYRTKENNERPTTTPRIKERSVDCGDCEKQLNETVDVRTSYTTLNNSEHVNFK